MLETHLEKGWRRPTHCAKKPQTSANCTGYIMLRFFWRLQQVGYLFYAPEKKVGYIHLQVAYSNISQTATFHCDSLLHGHFLLFDPSHVSSFPLRTVSPTLSARAPQFCLSSPVIITNKDSLQGSWRSAFRGLKVLENQQNNWH